MGTACKYLDDSIKLVDEATKITSENKDVKMGENVKEHFKLIDQNHGYTERRYQKIYNRGV